METKIIKQIIISLIKEMKKIFPGLLGICMLCFLQVPMSAQDPERTIDHPLEDSIIKGRTSINAYPYVFYTPESKFAAGAGGIFIFYTDKDTIVLPSKIGFGGYYSANKQYKISINPVIYFFENKLFFKAPISFGHFVDKFWGIGSTVPDTGDVAYTKDVFNATFTLQVPPAWFSADRTGIIFDYDNTTIVDKQNNELLLGDEVVGSNGGQLFGFGTDLLWDSRDNIFFPNNGGYQYVKILIYPDGINYTNFGYIELDVKHFRSFKEDHVFAGNIYFSSAFGDIPFYKLPAVGGPKNMRGYYAGRYRDNVFGMVQFEYRQFFWRKFGFVAFAGFGNVADEILNFSFSNLKYSYGAGLRFRFNEEQKVNLRMDLGFGNDGNMGIYFGIEEAF
jgi:outer membrane protein assembly factor BamA